MHKFLEEYLYNWMLLILIKEHIQVCFLLLDICHQLHVSLNLKKCLFCMLFGTLLRHVVHKEGLLVDWKTIVVIFYLMSLTSIKYLFTTFGHKVYYRRFIQNYVKFVVRLEKLLHKDVKYF